MLANLFSPPGPVTSSSITNTQSTPKSQSIASVPPAPPAPPTASSQTSNSTPATTRLNTGYNNNSDSNLIKKPAPPAPPPRSDLATNNTNGAKRNSLKPYNMTLSSYNEEYTMSSNLLNNAHYSKSQYYDDRFYNEANFESMNGYPISDDYYNICGTIVRAKKSLNNCKSLL